MGGYIGSKSSVTQVDGYTKAEADQAIADAAFDPNTLATVATTGSYTDLSNVPANIVVDASYVHTDNNYTTTEKNKLAGIEAGATADQTAAEILTAIKTVDGSGSGLDADTLDGNHASAFALASHTHDYVPERNYTDWNDGTVINNVVGQLAWKNYGNWHIIFDASQGTSPSGAGINNTYPDVAWTASYPTLMGWNGTNTYGVRVDRATLSENVTATYAGDRVGGYAFLKRYNSSGGYNPNATEAGSNLRYSASERENGPSASGTWRCLGYAQYTDRPTLWVRIS